MALPISKQFSYSFLTPEPYRPRKAARSPAKINKYIKTTFVFPALVVIIAGVEEAVPVALDVLVLVPFPVNASHVVKLCPPRNLPTVRASVKCTTW